MRFTIKDRIEKVNDSEINVGRRRNVVRFAFLPVKILKSWVWLERYVDIQEYKKLRIYSRPDEFLLGIFPVRGSEVNEHIFYRWQSVEKKIIE